jgi:hypothetical protein
VRPQAVPRSSDQPTGRLASRVARRRYRFGRMTWSSPGPLVQAQAERTSPQPSQSLFHQSHQSRASDGGMPTATATTTNVCCTSTL